MARVDQTPQIFVTLRIALPERPGRDVQRTDAGGTPARSEVIHIDARAISGIEERPQARRTEGWFESQIEERLRQVRKALIAARAGRRGHPQHGAFAFA